VLALVSHSHDGAPVHLSGSSAADTAASAGAAPPAASPARNCGQQVVQNTHKTAPAYMIMVPAGDNSGFNFGRPGTFWFASGVHTLGTGQYAQIDPVSGSAFVGAPGAVLSGQWKNHYAFGGNASHVTIEYLTIEYFGVGGVGDNQQEGVVNQDSAPYWTITHTTINDNGGAGVMLGSHDVVSYSCLENNGQYGFNAYSGEPGGTGITLTHTELLNNDTYNWEARQDGCGCTGGGKFWYDTDVTITDNWVVNNRSVGIWVDANNSGFTITGNLFQGNAEVGIQYEISYNATIEYNTFIGNGVIGGAANTGFPTGAIYISESGGDSRVASTPTTRIAIAANNFVNNWGGVILWENSNRFCNSPDDGTGLCTRVSPETASVKDCAASVIKLAPFFNNCRWRTQNVYVVNNNFTFNPKVVGAACEAAMKPGGAGTCGFNGVFSEYGSDPSWSPYTADIVPTNIAVNQNNHFTDNRYHGPWQFMGWQQGSVMTWAQWRSAASWQRLTGSGKAYGQDAGSTLSAS
jgi:parallel beta-helix repeat protein